METGLAGFPAALPSRSSSAAIDHTTGHLLGSNS